MLVIKSRKLATLRTGQRAFAAAPQECFDNMKKLGITNKNIVYNPT